MHPRIRVAVLAGELFALAGWTLAAPPHRPALPRGAPPEVARQVRRLADPRPAERADAIRALARLGPQAAVAAPFLRALLTDTAAVPPLPTPPNRTASVFGEPTVGRLASEALWQVRPPEFIAVLAEPDPAARRAAFEGLAERNRGPAGMELLLYAARDPSAPVRRAAVWGLRHLPAPRARRALLAACDDSSAGVRLAAAASLGYLDSADGDGKITTRLVRMLQADRQSRCRAAAAWALGRLSNRRAAAALRLAGRYPDPTVRRLARRALDRESQREDELRLLLALWRGEAVPAPAVPAVPVELTDNLRRGRASLAALPPGRPGGMSFRLGGILTGPTGRIAVINGRSRTVGQTVNGARVLRIDASAVQLERDGQVFTLRR